jgi:hypothetical protein
MFLPNGFYLLCYYLFEENQNNHDVWNLHESNQEYFILCEKCHLKWCCRQINVFLKIYYACHWAKYHRNVLKYTEFLLNLSNLNKRINYVFKAAESYSRKLYFLQTRA